MSIACSEVKEAARALAGSLYVSFLFQPVQELHDSFFGAVLVEPNRAFVFG